MWIKRFLERQEQRQLNRDARVIIEEASEIYRAELLRDTALTTKRGIDESVEHCKGHAECLDRELRRLKDLHAQARRTYQQGPLTAFTLAIIYLKTESFPDACQPARDAIREFISRFEHASEGGDDTLVI